METLDAFATAYPLNILIADENPLGLSETRQLLSGLGYQPESVATRSDLLQKAAKQRYDMILLDITMPGFEQMVNVLSPGPEVRPLIIAVLDSIRPTLREICLKNIVDYCISRPLKKAELLLQLKACSLLAGKCHIR